MSKKIAVVCDLDGTMALNNSGRSYYNEKRCYEDDPNAKVIMVVASLMIGLGDYFGEDNVDFLVVSERKDHARDETMRWLNDKAGLGEVSLKLFMRKSDDNRDDTIVKEEIYREHIEPFYHVIAWFDDRNKVVKHLRSLDIPVFQVADGDF